MPKNIGWILTAVIAVTSCSSQNDASNSNSGLTLSGSVVDDYVVGAEISISLGPSAPSDTDITAVTGSNGEYEVNMNLQTYQNWTGTLTAVGGLNRLTSGDFNTRLTRSYDKVAAQQGLAIEDVAITPITSLLSNMEDAEQKLALAECLLGTGKTEADLLADYKTSEDGKLAVAAMKLQKSVELVQDAVEQVLKELKAADSLEELANLNLDNIDFPAISASAFSQIADKIEALESANALCQSDPISQAVSETSNTNNEVLAGINLDQSVLGNLDDTTFDTLKTKLGVSSETLQIGQLIETSDSAKQLFEQTQSIALAFDKSVNQMNLTGKDLVVENVLWGGELMKDQAAQLLKGSIETANLTVAAKFLTDDEAIETSQTDFDALSAAVTTAESTASVDTLKADAKLSFAFNSDLTNQYFKLSASDQSESGANFYFFEEGDGYLCVKEENVEEAYAAPFNYGVFKSNAMSLSVSEVSGKLILNKVDDSQNISATVDYGSGSESFLLNFSDQAYFVLEDDLEAGYQNLSFISFDQMAEKDPGDYAYIDFDKHTVDCQKVNYLVNP
jgi:hypothetical protein